MSDSVKGLNVKIGDEELHVIEMNKLLRDYTIG